MMPSSTSPRRPDGHREHSTDAPADRNLVQRLDDLTQDVRDLRSTVVARIEQVENQVGDLRERLARLEASKEADRSLIQAEIARFKAEVERAEVRLGRMLPPGENGP